MKRRAFSGFPKEGLQFLRSLKRNNNREWFQDHKSIYEQHVKQPINDLIETLAEDFQEFAPEMVATTKISAYRIYRDTRFSKDKSPYKTHAAAVFPRAGLGKHGGAGFYLHISPSEVFVGGGLYMPIPEDISVVRHRIATEPDIFLSIVGNRQFRKLFDGITGEKLSRVPRGFPLDHPAAEYLKYKSFLAARRFPAEISTTPQFYSLTIETFKALLPMIRFINEPILAARRIRDRQEALLGM